MRIEMLKITPWLTSHKWKTVCVSWSTNFFEGVCLFKSWLVHGLLVLLFYDIKNLLRFCWDRHRLRLSLHAVHTLSLHAVHLLRSWLKKRVFMWFYYPILGSFFLILLSWGCLSKFNLTRLLPICLWRNLKSSFQLIDQTKVWVSSQQNFRSNQAYTS